MTLYADSLVGKYGDETADWAKKDIVLTQADGVIALTVQRLAPPSHPERATRTIHRFDGVTYLPIDEITTKADGKVTNASSWDFRKRNGIEIPVKIHRLENDPITGDFRSKREFSLLTCQVNSPIKASTFAVSSLGIKKGDRLVDVASKTLMMQTDQMLEPVETVDAFTMSPPADFGRDDRIPWFTWYYVAGIVVAGAGIIVILWRTKFFRSFTSQLG
jgi:hypothetical protein